MYSRRCYVKDFIFRKRFSRAKLSLTNQVDSELLISQTRSLFLHCNVEHLREIKPVVCSICREFTIYLTSRGMALRGIPIILMAIEKVRNSPEQLTSIHADVCQLALSAKCFKPVLPLLDTDILDSECDKNAFGLQDALLYFYYGGMIYGALRKWDRSLHFFNMCFMIPISTQRSILDEAAKKHLLVSLIHQGKYPPDGVYLESIHSLMPTRQGTFDKYRALSNAFSSPDPATLARVIDNEAETFRADKNFGLVKQLLDRHIKCRIQNLTKTFMTLSLSDLAARVHLSDAAEAEHHLLEMIPSKSIHVRINQEDETVRFLDDAERYDSAEMLKVLSQKMEKAMNLEKKMMQMSDQLALVLAASKKQSSVVQ
uniref:COP9 signalosome complex subunit 3 n=1 Tax=Schistocephalus solidus TaxID=70667 RepID=A0A0V0J294_SCHSO